MAICVYATLGNDPQLNTHSDGFNGALVKVVVMTVSTGKGWSHVVQSTICFRRQTVPSSYATLLQTVEFLPPLS